MSTAPHSAAPVAAVGTAGEQHEWLGKQTADDADLAMATYDLTHVAKQS
jgi:hypothetical protein